MLSDVLTALCMLCKDISASAYKPSTICRSHRGFYPKLIDGGISLTLQSAAQVPRYGLVTTANCNQLMLALEDRHGETGVDNQDLDLTLLRAAQVNAQINLHHLVVSLQRMSLPVTHAALCSLPSPNADCCAHSLPQRCIPLSKHVSVCYVTSLLQHTWSTCLDAASVHQHITLGLLKYACVQASRVQILTGPAQTIQPSAPQEHDL